MFRLHKVLRAGVTVLLMLFVVDSATPDVSAQKASRPPKPHVPRAGRAHYTIVQARDPHWRVMTVAPNHEAAHIMKLRLHRRRYQVRLRQESAGRVLVFARMMHWHAVGIFNSTPMANHMIAMLRARGMQARIHKV